MALVEVARLWNLPEAWVVKSALDAAGFTAFVFDEHRANALWTEQLAIGGIRLMTPASEAQDAMSLIARAKEPSSTTEQPPTRQRVSLTTYLVACLLFGWPLAGFKRPDAFHRMTAAIVVGAMTLALVVVLRP